VSLLTRLLRRAGRFLEPLFDADADGRRARDAKLLGLIAEHERTQRALQAETARQREELTRMRGHVEAIDEAQLPQLRDAVKQVRSSVSRQERILKRSRVADVQYAEAQRVLWRLERLSRGDRRILVGPWTGEVGFELLYWIPFLRWALNEYHVDPQRVVVMSRGGTRPWYEGLHGGYVDALELMSVETFREGTSDKKKQRLLRQFDRQLLRSARTTLGGEPVTVLHPGMMYALFMPYWKRQASIQRVLDHVAFAPLGAAPARRVPGLPAEYVAVRFYFSSCFPDTPRNRAFATDAIASLAEHYDVVLLDPQLNIDDHRDAPGTMQPRVHRLPAVPEPATNLALQTEVIRGARAFVGTYGGYAYLAPFYGVDAVAFFSDRNYYAHHLELAHRALERVNGGTLQVVDVAAGGWLSSALRRVAAAPAAGHADA
jgi:hypothetical protein